MCRKEGGGRECPTKNISEYMYTCTDLRKSTLFVTENPVRGGEGGRGSG